MALGQYLLLVNLYLILFYGFYILLLSRETFFHLNRIYLVASSLLSFFIPLIQSNWVKNLFITQEVQYTIAIYSHPMMVYPFKPIEDHITIGKLLLLIYLTGAFILVVKFIWQLVSLKRVINKPGTVGAFSFFQKINLGTNLDNRDVIEVHERVHMREWHSVDVLLIEVISIINWFNPIVYLYRLAIKHIHEFIADRQALKAGTNKETYALLLLSQTFKTPVHQLVNPFFNHSLLKRRIIMLQKNNSQRMALLKYGLSAPLFILMLILSSATISKSRTVKLFNNKAEEVFLTPASSTDSAVDDSTRAYAEELSEITPQKQKLAIVKDTVPAKNDGPVFSAVESEPEFQDGMDAFYRFLGQNIRYPEAMRKNNVEGKVYVTFIVEKDGSLSDIKSLRDVGYGSAEESIRVIKLSPRWKPGYQNQRPVRVQYAVPISFSLQKDKMPKDTSLKTGEVEFKKYKADYNRSNNYLADSSKKTTWTLKSINSQSQPLYLLDGKEINDLHNVNASDIECISVLKPKVNDNTLATLYGSRASLNGVVLITTKNAAKKSPPKN